MEDDDEKSLQILNDCLEGKFELDEFIISDNEEDETAEETEDIVNIDEEINYLKDIKNTDLSNLNTHSETETLESSEQSIIDACPDPTLKRLLQLNRTKNLNLRQLYKNLKEILVKCQRSIVIKCKNFQAELEIKKKHSRQMGWRLGAPFFKDADLYEAPINDDVRRKRQNKELPYSELASSNKWKNRECEKLIRAVKMNYTINKQNFIVKQIAEQPSTSHLIELETELAALSANDATPPLNSDKFIDWNRISSKFFYDRHSELECKSFWHIYLHPEINKDDWTEEEDMELLKIAKEFDYQNWEGIAEKLNTKRSGFVCCYHYCAALNKHVKCGEFTPEEDALLLQLVNQFTHGNVTKWSSIAVHFQNRSRVQLYYRYNYYLKEKHKVCRSKFSEAEDVLLLILVEKFGRRYGACAKYFPGRTHVQLKSRYSTLTNSVRKGSFTKEDDLRILEYVKEHGTKKWGGLTQEMERSRGQIRQRYVTITKNSNKIANNFRTRQTALAKQQGDSSLEFLQFVADLFKNRKTIPSLKIIKNTITDNKLANKKRVESVRDLIQPNEEDAEYNIDDLLANYFCNFINRERPVMVKTPYNIQTAIENVRSIINVLGAKLHIPKNLEANSQLDAFDVAILSGLTFNSSYVTCDRTAQFDVILPPIGNSLIGMRTMLVNDSLSAEPSDSSILNNYIENEDDYWEADKYLMTLSDYTQQKAQREENLFFKRFYVLFKWPSLLTIFTPQDSLVKSRCKAMLKKLNQKKRTYSKIASPTGEQMRKVVVHEVEGSVVLPPRTLTLKPVSKQEIAQLKDKGKLKLFRFENQEDGTGLVKTVVKKVEEPVPSTSQSDNIANLLDDLIFNDFEGDDEEADLRKLQKVVELGSSSNDL